RYAYYSSDSEQTVHSSSLSSLLPANQSCRELFGSNENTWWLDCNNPTEAELRVLSTTFNIHPLTCEDIKTQDCREKVELFKNYYFVSFHTFDSDRQSPTFLKIINFYIVVFKHGILTFHFTSVPHPGVVRRRVNQLRDYVDVTADWLCYALIDDIIDSFAPVIKQIEVEADHIENLVFVCRDKNFGEMLTRIFASRKKIMNLLRLLSFKSDVIKMFKRFASEIISHPRTEVALYLDDIQDHVITMHQSLIAYEKMFSKSHSNYLAQLQVESFNANFRITEILSKVTLIGTMLIPLNLVTGLFGMNVVVPGQEIDSLVWFFSIVGFLCLLVTCGAIF
ncbi:hypothetical protein DFJ63DRAFT_275932, partial [Scheffersomyces coipomensis]|uniref:uncharacterized protein n=1 Tax=Scheffersomyces coipomensis TaxID=1788519 RepID=UPI00315C6259